MIYLLNALILLLSIKSVRYVKISHGGDVLKKAIFLSMICSSSMAAVTTPLEYNMADENITEAQNMMIESKIDHNIDKPKNELGIYGDEAHDSLSNSHWGFASGHYYRYTDYGTYGARINFAKRYGVTGEQYKLEAYPMFHNSSPLQYIT